MTRSVDRHLFRYAISAVFISLHTAHAGLQIDARSGILLGMTDSTQSAVGPAVGLGGIMYGSFALGNDLRFIVQDNLARVFSIAGGGGENESDDGSSSPAVNAVAGASKRLPIPEQNVPSSNDGSIVLRYKGLQAGYRNIAYGTTRALDSLDYMQRYFGYFDPSGNYFTYTRRFRYFYEGGYLLQNDRYLFDARVVHGVTQGSISTMTSPTETARTDPDLSKWLRTRLTAGFRIPGAQLQMQLGTVMLNNLNRPAEFDTYDYFASLEGELSPGDNKLEYRLRNDYFKQAYLNDPATQAHNARTGMFQTVFLRNSYTMTYGLMLKGLAVVTYNGYFFKQRYEFTVRKAWLEGSSLDLGYFTTLGGLFPMNGYYIRTMFQPVEQFDIGLRLKSDWDWPRENASEFAAHSKTLFVKAGGGVEMCYRMVRSLEMYLSGDYTYYNPTTAIDFPARFFGGGGIRVCLP